MKKVRKRPARRVRRGMMTQDKFITLGNKPNYIYEGLVIDEFVNKNEVLLRFMRHNKAKMDEVLYALRRVCYEKGERLVRYEKAENDKYKRVENIYVRLRIRDELLAMKF